MQITNTAPSPTVARLTCSTVPNKGIRLGSAFDLNTVWNKFYIPPVTCCVVKFTLMCGVGPILLVETFMVRQPLIRVSCRQPLPAKVNSKNGLGCVACMESQHHSAYRATRLPKHVMATPTLGQPTPPREIDKNKMVAQTVNTAVEITRSSREPVPTKVGTYNNSVPA